MLSFVIYQTLQQADKGSASPLWVEESSSLITSLINPSSPLQHTSAICAFCHYGPHMYSTLSNYYTLDAPQTDCGHHVGIKKSKQNKKTWTDTSASHQSSRFPPSFLPPHVLCASSSIVFFWFVSSHHRACDSLFFRTRHISFTEQQKKEKKEEIKETNKKKNPMEMWYTAIKCSELETDGMVLCGKKNYVKCLYIFCSF